MEAVQTTPYVFLSYASADREKAVHIADLLEARGVAVWIDRKSIAGGTSWGAEIVRGIRECAVLVVACTPAAVVSPNVQQEIQLAWETRRPILPLLLQAVDLPDSIRYALAGRQWIEVLDHADDAWLGQAQRALVSLGLSPRPPSLPRPEILPASPATSASESVRRHNLPSPATSFVGRERELIEIRQLLLEPASVGRLVTLTGIGGCGKTRLALHVAADLIASFPDGVWFVDLAPLGDPALVPQAIAAALSVREVPGQGLLATLTDYLSARHVLLVLDNCEHLIDACARITQTLLQGCPRVRILATSREMLGLPGEATRRVPSLAVPDPRDRPPLAVVVESDAVHLFLDRARAGVPTFAVTPDNAMDVLRICHRLDGIPLAIELAAARVRVLTVEQIAARLSDRFRLLTGGSRTALRRQQTLRATIDWSYDLLTDGERTLLRRLSAFAGGWTLDAAEAVGADGSPGIPEDVLDVLTRLVDKSLVLAEGQGGEERYRLLETIRQYAEEKLLDEGEAAAVRSRHRDWYLRLTDNREWERMDVSWEGWHRRLNPERDNLRAALEWSRSTDEDPVLGLRLAANLVFFWNGRAGLEEGRSWLRAFLALFPERTVLRARALSGASHLARWASDPVEARRLAEEELGICREIGDRGGLGRALLAVGLARANDGDYAGARSRLEESLAIRQEIGDEADISMTTLDLGLISLAEGEDLARARRYLEDSLVLARGLGGLGGDMRVRRALYFLAGLERLDGDVVRAGTTWELPDRVERAVPGSGPEQSPCDRP